MATAYNFTHQAIEALCHQKLTIGQALGLVDDLEVIRLFEHLCEIEKFLHLVEQTDCAPGENWQQVYRRLQSLKNMAATEFFKRTQL